LIETLGAAPRQQPFDVAVVLPTLLRPSLTRAVRSIFAQDFRGRIQVLVGIDVAQGDRGQLQALGRECPGNIALDIVDLGYSTSIQHGGVYPNRCTGSLRTVLSYAANSRYVAYLDDDNWWAPDHLGSLCTAIAGRDWSWSLRWFVEPGGDAAICIDEWESVGPDAGLYREAYGGFVDPSSLLVDKMACHDVLPYWSLTPYADGRGSDRLIFQQLRDRPHSGTGRASSFYTINARDPQHLVRLQLMRQTGVALPSDRRRGVVPLAELVGPTGTAAAVPVSPAAAVADAVLGPVLQLLRPAEAVTIGAGDGGAVLALARTAQAIGLDCLFVAGSGAAAPVRDGLQHRIEALGLGASLRLLSAEAGTGAAFLTGAPLAVDLVQLGPEVSGAEAWRAGFTILRPGGFLLGHGPTNDALEKFVSASGSSLLPISEPGSDERWIVQKGLDWAG
jgi:hypothetical protein